MRLVGIAALLSGLLLGMSMVARAWGQGKSPNPVLAGFEIGCNHTDAPCWYGIIPGVTTSQQAHIILQKVADDVAVVRRDNGGQIRTAFDATHCRANLDFDTLPVGLVYQISLWDCDGLQLGDTIGVLGAPVMFDACAFISNRPTFFYPDGSKSTLERRIPRRDLRSAAISPFSELRLVSLSPTRYPPIGHLRWHGFIRLWRYCRVQSG
jgi:hypothetical protein